MAGRQVVVTVVVGEDVRAVQRIGVTVIARAAWNLLCDCLTVICDVDLEDVGFLAIARFRDRSCPATVEGSAMPKLAARVCRLLVTIGS